MKVKRTITVETQNFEVGDIVPFSLKDGEFVEAVAVKAEKDGMVFLLVDCLRDEYAMNNTATNKGGYGACQLRNTLNGEILDRFPERIRDNMLPFDNGDLLRLPTEKEIFGENVRGEDELADVEQLEPMKLRRNRIASQGHNGALEWYWLQNAAKHSASRFAFVNSNGFAYSYYASHAGGVRPAFKIKYL